MMKNISCKPISVRDLPLPPKGSIGWPWTTGITSINDLHFDGKNYPKISIITPSYNQGKYLEESIRSVLLQGYPNFEYIIIDGSSTDDSVNIIRKYEKWITAWVSEHDDGQSDAINKGFSLCTGEITNWLCSDDIYTEGAFFKVARHFMGANACDVLAGACFCKFEHNPHKSGIRPAKGKIWEATPYIDGVWQPSCFWRRNLITRDFLVNSKLHFCMDRELWCYIISLGINWRWTGEVFSVFRYTGENKSMLGKRRIIEELDQIYRNYNPEVIAMPWLLRSFWLPLVVISIRNKIPIVRVISLALSKLSVALLMLFYKKNRVRSLQQEFYVYSIW